VVNKFAHVRFEPSGFTGNPEIPIAKSLVDYIFRWMGSRFLPSEEKGALGLIDRSAVVAEAPAAFGASALRPRADEGITAQSEAISAGTPAPVVAADPAPAPTHPASGDVARASAPAAPSVAAAPAAPPINATVDKPRLGRRRQGVRARGSLGRRGSCCPADQRDRGQARAGDDRQQRRGQRLRSSERQRERQADPGLVRRLPWWRPEGRVRCPGGCPVLR
jgi:hypothetical protein